MNVFICPTPEERPPKYASDICDDIPSGLSGWVRGREFSDSPGLSQWCRFRSRKLPREICTTLETGGRIFYPRTHVKSF